MKKKVPKDGVTAALPSPHIGQTRINSLYMSRPERALLVRAHVLTECERDGDPRRQRRGSRLPTRLRPYRPGLVNFRLEGPLEFWTSLGCLLLLSR